LLLVERVVAVTLHTAEVFGTQAVVELVAI
jgi:hypothetical protein